MGLDMYLSRKQYVKDWDHTPEEDRNNTEVFIRGKKIDTKEISYLEFSAMYWRKDNHIHNWFVQNCQNGDDDCRPYRVDIDELKELRDLCIYVNKDRDKADELLPTKEGFFFGDTEYDEYYFESLERTADALDGLIKEHPNDEYIYQSSW